MCHQLAREYGWSKHQIDEVYPQEAIVMIKFIAFDKHDKELADKIHYYTNMTHLLSIQHAEDPNEFRDSCIRTIESLQNLKIQKPTIAIDDDMPDFARINQLRNTLKKQAENMR